MQFIAMSAIILFALPFSPFLDEQLDVASTSLHSIDLSSCSSTGRSRSSAYTTQSFLPLGADALVLSCDMSYSSHRSILPALTVSKSFSQFYGFKAGRIGLCLSLSTTIGGVLGELVAGPVIDRQLHAARAKHGGNAPPETRLWGLLPGVFLLPVRRYLPC